MIQSCYAFLETDSEEMTGMDLRKYLHYLFANDLEFSRAQKAFEYKYPLIQYKSVNERLLVLGLNEYSKLIFNKLSRLDDIVSKKEKHSITSVEFKNETFEVKNEDTEYEFLSPCILLNKKNYSEYKTLKEDERDEFLEKILVGSFLSTLKGLGVRVDYQVKVEIKEMRSGMIKVEGTTWNNEFVGFLGTISSNVLLPNYVGIGKTVSKGFGILNRTRT